MSDERWWARARQARDRLEALLMSDPTFRQVSIGLDPLHLSEAPVLIVHVRRSSTVPPNLPDEIDGITVRVAQGDFELQEGQS
jgi:hypothetical protein